MQKKRNTSEKRTADISKARKDLEKYNFLVWLGSFTRL